MTREEKIQEMIAQAVSRGSKLPYEQMYALFAKSYDKSQPKKLSNKDVEKMERKNRVAQAVVEFEEKGGSIDNSDIYREAALRQRGSSMRY